MQCVGSNAACMRFDSGMGGHRGHRWHDECGHMQFRSLAAIAWPNMYREKPHLVKRILEPGLELVDLNHHRCRHSCAVAAPSGLGTASEWMEGPAGSGLAGGVLTHLGTLYKPSCSLGRSASLLRLISGDHGSGAVRRASRYSNQK